MRWHHLKAWDTGVRWREDECQSYAVYKLKRMRGYNRWWAFAGDMNGLADTDEKRLRGDACGLMPGETDMRIYFRGGSVVWIENKVSGRELRDEQVKRHALLRRLGFTVYSVYAETPWDCWVQIRDIVQRHMRIPLFRWLW